MENVCVRTKSNLVVRANCRFKKKFQGSKKLGSKKLVKGREVENLPVRT